MSQLPKVGDAEFDAEVMKSDRLTVVDFSADWCAPCKKLHPVMEQLATEYNGRVKVVLVDVAEAPEVAARYSVINIPRIMFFSKGIVRETVVGLIPKSKIQDKIDQYLA